MRGLDGEGGFSESPNPNDNLRGGAAGELVIRFSLVFLMEILIVSLLGVNLLIWYLGVIR